MRIAIFGSGARAEAVLRAMLRNRIDVRLCVFSGHDRNDPFARLARLQQIPIYGPKNPNNDRDLVAALRNLPPDILFCVAYHHRLAKELLDCCSVCINFHAGDLSRFRGSSPMNWALLEGEKAITISACRMETEIDGGDIVKERIIAISDNAKIADIHSLASAAFADFAVELVSEVEHGIMRPITAASESYRYCSKRFPDDSFIPWDTMSAWEVHNLIRASASPYSGAISFLKGQEVRVLESIWTPNLNIKTAPGRVCRIVQNGFFVGAKDRALLVSEIAYVSRHRNVFDDVRLYDKFLTTADFLIQSMRKD